MTTSLSHPPDRSAGTAAPPSPALPLRTPALVHERYGESGALRLGEVELAPLEPDQVLVEVRATSVNPADWYGVTGFLPARLGNGLRAPRSPFAGTDVAGRVIAVGESVSCIAVGEDVFGTCAGAWAHHAVARESKLARKPSAVSFAEAAAAPVAALTALQAVRDRGKVAAGSRVLVNGASGGVGTFAVQLARWLGAEVTAVCSSGNVELASSLGAGRVVDYTEEDFTRLDERYEVLVDIAGSRPLRRLRRVLTPDATVVLVGAPMSYRGLGPLPHLVGTKLSGIFRSQTATFFVAQINSADLELVGGLLADGTIRSVIDGAFDGLEGVEEALRVLGEGHARGKLVVTLPEAASRG